MLRKCFYLIGFVSWLALVACSSGTVDPNANPLAVGGDSSSLESSSSSGWINQPEISVDPESSSSAGEEGLSKSVKIAFDTKVTDVVAIETKSGAASKSDGKILVYGEEKGAAASCAGDAKSYSTKFKLGPGNRVERSIVLNNFGAECETVFENFKSLCLIKTAEDPFVGSCDDKGNLDAYCAYTEGDAVFESVLSEFTLESKSDCSESVSLNSFGL